MADNSEARLSAGYLEQIRLSQYEIDKRFWLELAEMQVSAMEQLASTLPSATRRRTPIMPVSPITLFGILRRYAIESFDCEFSRYTGPDRSSLGGKLVDKIEKLIIRNVANIDRPEPPGTAHHATYDQMRAAVRAALNEHLRAISAPVVDQSQRTHKVESIDAPSSSPEESDFAPFAPRMDKAIAVLDITHVELARRMKVPKTTYFAVKRGDGKPSTKYKVDGYLRELNKSDPRTAL